MNVPAVFLDRDGTVIRDKGYLADAGGVELLPGAGEALRRLQNAGFALAIVTNQSGIGRGYFGADVVDAQHQRLDTDLRISFGVTLDAIAYCPHAPDAMCECRKPRPGLLLALARAHGFALQQSYMIGDRASDVGAGAQAGCRTIFIGDSCDGADCCCRDLPAAATCILTMADTVEANCS